MSQMILRVTSRGGLEENEDFDMEGPADLVAIELLEDGTEAEVDRKEFSSGHEASKFLCSLLKR